MSTAKRKNHEAKILETVTDVNDCDAACKRVLSMRSIVAPILKQLVPEFRDVDISTIKTKCIGAPSIGADPIDVDELPPAITLENSDDVTIMEGKRLYDVKFTATIPTASSNKINLIINIEAQKNFSPGYALIRRGIYYCSRLISAQYGTVFTHSDFNKLRKVYSIWICTRPDKEHRNTIEKFSFSPSKIFGNPKPTKESDYDLMTVIMVCLENSPNISDSKNDIIKMLSILFNSTVESSEKQKILEQELGIIMTENEKKEVDTMCDISQGYIEAGEERIIIRMLENGRTPEEIAQFTGMPIQWVREIAEKFGYFFD